MSNRLKLISFNKDEQDPKILLMNEVKRKEKELKLKELEIKKAEEKRKEEIRLEKEKKNKYLHKAEPTPFIDETYKKIIDEEYQRKNRKYSSESEEDFEKKAPLKKSNVKNVSIDKLKIRESISKSIVKKNVYNKKEKTKYDPNSIKEKKLEQPKNLDKNIFEIEEEIEAPLDKIQLNKNGQTIDQGEITEPEEDEVPLTIDEILIRKMEKYKSSFWQNYDVSYALQPQLVKIVEKENLNYIAQKHIIENDSRNEIIKDSQKQDKHNHNQNFNKDKKQAKLQPTLSMNKEDDLDEDTYNSLISKQFTQFIKPNANLTPVHRISMQLKHENSKSKIFDNDIKLNLHQFNKDPKSHRSDSTSVDDFKIVIKTSKDNNDLSSNSNSNSNSRYTHSIETSKQSKTSELNPSALAASDHDFLTKMMTENESEVFRHAFDKYKCIVHIGKSSEIIKDHVLEVPNYLEFLREYEILTINKQQSISLNQLKAKNMGLLTQMYHVHNNLQSSDQESIWYNYNKTPKGLTMKYFILLLYAIWKRMFKIEHLGNNLDENIYKNLLNHLTKYKINYIVESVLEPDIQKSFNKQGSNKKDFNIENQNMSLIKEKIDKNYGYKKKNNVDLQLPVLNVSQNESLTGSNNYNNSMNNNNNFDILSNKKEKSIINSPVNSPLKSDNYVKTTNKSRNKK